MVSFYNTINKAALRILSLKNGGHSMINYIDTKNLYNNSYNENMIKELGRMSVLSPLVEKYFKKKKARVRLFVAIIELKYR